MIIVKSKKTLEDLAKAIEAAVPKHGFGVMGKHDLRDKMRSKGIPFEPGCLVYEVCNPAQAKKVLEIDLSISTALPCRISAYETPNGVELATIEPSQMIGMFGHPELKGVADEVEATMRRIMNDAANG